MQMTKSGLPKSVRKFIRLEKARIRAKFFDFKKQEELINELYKNFSGSPVAESKILEEKPATKNSRGDVGGEIKEIEPKTKKVVKNKKVHTIK